MENYFACSCPVEVLAKGFGAGWGASTDAWWCGLVLMFKVIRLPDTKEVDKKLECVIFWLIVQIRALIESCERIGHISWRDKGQYIRERVNR